MLNEIETNIYPYYYNVSNTEISIRCPYCGDSIKSDKSAHLYIEINNPNVCRFYCQRCSISGIVTNDLFKDIGIFNNKLNAQFHKMNKDNRYNGASIKKGNSSIISRKKDLIIPKAHGTDYEVNKLKYLIERLGVSITEKEAREKFNVILNFEEFVLENDIKSFNIPEEYKEKTVYDFYRYSIGFLSNDQTNIIFRSINTDKTYWRYYNYNIFNNYDNSMRMYSISNKIDLLADVLNVYITEGIFDILGVYNNVYNKEKTNDNDLFIAVNGKGYNLIFLHLMRLGFLNLNIHIFSDSDVNRRFYENMKKYNEVLSDTKINLYYNKLSKDFGVPKEYIELKRSFI